MVDPRKSKKIYNRDFFDFCYYIIQISNNKTIDFSAFFMYHKVLFNGEQMKKIVLFLLCAFMLCACGVKSDLSRPNGALRDYPVY